MSDNLGLSLQVSRPTMRAFGFDIRDGDDPGWNIIQLPGNEECEQVRFGDLLRASGMRVGKPYFLVSLTYPRQSFAADDACSEPTMMLPDQAILTLVNIRWRPWLASPKTIARADSIRDTLSGKGASSFEHLRSLETILSEILAQPPKLF